MTSNQRDILAGFLTARMMNKWDRDDEADWVSFYEFYRNKINEVIEGGNDEKDADNRRA